MLELQLRMTHQRDELPFCIDLFVPSTAISAAPTFRAYPGGSYSISRCRCSIIETEIGREELRIYSLPVPYAVVIGPVKSPRSKDAAGQ